MLIFLIDTFTAVVAVATAAFMHTQSFGLWLFAIDTSTSNFGISAIRCLKLLNSRCFTVFYSFISCNTDVCCTYVSFIFTPKPFRCLEMVIFLVFCFFTISFSCRRMRHMLFLSKSTTFTMKRVHSIVFPHQNHFRRKFITFCATPKPFSFYHIIYSAHLIFFFFFNQKKKHKRPNYLINP